jgi:hypothetical protein
VEKRQITFVRTARGLSQAHLIEVEIRGVASVLGEQEAQRDTLPLMP